MITIVYESQEADLGSKGLGRASSAIVRRIGSVSPEALKQNLNDICATISSILEGMEQKVSSYQLEKIEIATEITAEGEIRLIGSASASVTGGLKLVFSRASQD